MIPSIVQRLLTADHSLVVQSFSDAFQLQQRSTLESVYCVFVAYAAGWLVWEIGG